MARDSRLSAVVGAWPVGLLIALLVALWPDVAGAQCAMCRKALETPEGRQMAAAFRGGILVLLAAPFSLVALIATLVVKMQRRRTLSSGGVPPRGAERPA